MQGGELVALFTPGGSPKQNTLARLPFEFDFQGIRTRGKLCEMIRWLSLDPMRIYGTLGPWASLK